MVSMQSNWFNKTTAAINEMNRNKPHEHHFNLFSDVKNEGDDDREQKKNSASLPVHFGCSQSFSVHSLAGTEAWFSLNYRWELLLSISKSSKANPVQFTRIGYINK